MKEIKTKTFKKRVKWLSLDSKFVVVYNVSSKLVHAFCLQTPMIAKCLTRLLCNGRYYDNNIMARMWGRWWHATTKVSFKLVDWWASYTISNIFQYGGRPPSWILKIFIFGHVTAIVFHICSSIPNFIKIGSRVRPPDAHNCLMFNVRLLGNGRYHGNRIMAAMFGTWWDTITQVSSKSVHS